MNKADREQIRILEKYVSRKPKPHVCKWCKWQVHDSHDVPRCLYVESIYFLRRADDDETCSGWEIEIPQPQGDG